MKNLEMDVNSPNEAVATQPVGEQMLVCPKCGKKLSHIGKTVIIEREEVLKWEDGFYLFDQVWDEKATERYYCLYCNKTLKVSK